jgi:heat shock protein HslJ
MVKVNAANLCSALLLTLLTGCSSMFGGKPALPLSATSWTATGIAGKGGVTALIAGSKATLNFGADGTLSGSAGCNSYTGRYEITGNQIRFPNAFASTRKMCVNPGVMDQEQAFLKALSASTTGRIDGRKLELRDAGGTLQIAAMAN